MEEVIAQKNLSTSGMPLGLKKSSSMPYVEQMEESFYDNPAPRVSPSKHFRLSEDIAESFVRPKFDFEDLQKVKKEKNFDEFSFNLSRSQRKYQDRDI